MFPSGDFYNNKTYASGKMNSCKRCYNAQGKRWKLANPVRSARYSRTSRLNATYGITADQFDTMLAAQEWRCAICRDIEPGGGRTGALSVDHDHVTGKVRGILCHQCNMALGKFKDNPELLRRAADYLVGIN